LFRSGGDVLSHRGSPAVPSAQRGLTSEFGMGSGDPPRHCHRFPGPLSCLSLLGPSTGCFRGSREALQRPLYVCRASSRLLGLAGDAIQPVKPHGPLVRLGSTHRCASTCRLSTWWSPTALQCVATGRTHLG